MVTAYVGLGSNLGDGRQNILAGWKILGETEGVHTLLLSSPYLSEPVGIETEFWFTNAAGMLQTSLSPGALLERMLEIETSLGRKRGVSEDRQLDLDLLYYDEVICDGPGLVIPHPEIANRLFVLAPLAEIAPDFIHPVRRQTTMEMLENIVDHTVVVRKSWAKDGKIN